MSQETFIDLIAFLTERDTGHDSLDGTRDFAKSRRIPQQTLCDYLEENGITSDHLVVRLMFPLAL